ncbi:bifunctional phosphoribosyl-AMP cyclohydrolase/phosphoribosyl-ATP diphosphatase [Terribacillus saccharophilus]|uniref:bifunctional phosphoribosyl-AMP cyclohydrolase/phosphoribosyl-ATP diphosphatase HisIE n=1 Tax=Terribacillus saccharophilus TaxID=361277 RepID=UPI000BA5933C|nr:bifunctional phosphoribosyl-AMP cyclohydrolase/phosphoribosyl-ATP diphosphatase HisIE [Terribacillus saccharophilus]PAF19273.1 bifunctional phosphoribosyl-AMP cyclohydrolase/phosphoribosyl-ATP diphosphatase [Terribacillus saccharophilus]PAF22359.1 bifunctional phosphoribosyl-AMP cyclohydrolase/phosphoribosyl-ATP diphosphatase [Terribacillus saccharophilus]PAF38550.1 bifunctional phosphoribosyl-AMP cyclohydrolase/phosphoribosyl-ATP diphosphatase [Terribacillus saccharophilus]
MKPDFSKGLVPAIVQDSQTKQVLMLAYMNEEAYEKTVETKETWFYSRSREELWNKGSTSGNFQQVIDMKLDCDNDTILISVIPKGPACHTGKVSCFFNETPITGDSEKEANIFKTIMDEAEDRKKHPVEKSYTNYLYQKGVDKIGKKVIEEAGEVVIAAKNDDPEELINEVSDLLYHSFVLLANQGVSLQEVEAELARRFQKKGNNKGERPPIEEW